MANSNTNEMTQPEAQPDVSNRQQVPSHSPLRLRNLNNMNVNLVRPNIRSILFKSSVYRFGIVSFCIILSILIPILIVRRNHISRSKTLLRLTNQHHTYRPYTYDVTPPPSKPPPTQPTIPICQPPLIFSIPYHGSNWFADVVSQCTLSQENPQNSLGFNIANQQLEVWNPNPERIASNYTPKMASEILQERALKIFPAAFFSNKDNIKKLLTILPDHVPVVFLRRQTINAFTNHITIKDQTSPNLDVNLRIDKRFNEYESRVNSFFYHSATMMEKTQRKFDIVKFENAISQRWIILKRYKCYIKNCLYGHTTSTQ